LREKDSGIFEKEIQEAMEWITTFGIGDFIGSGYEDQLSGVDGNLIWTEYMSGSEGDFAFNGYEPGNVDEELVPQGYYVGSVAWTCEGKSMYITTFAYEECACDGDDENCETCEGEGSLEYPIVELARERLAGSGQLRHGGVASKQRFCEECGAATGPKAKFCSGCGHSILSV
jgi:ribosomal protein S27AE